MQKVRLLQKNQCYVLIVAVYFFRTTNKKWLLLSAQVNYNSHYRTALENIASLKHDVLVLNRCLKDDQIYSRCDGQLLYKYPEILQVSIAGASFKILVKRYGVPDLMQGHIYSNCGGMQCPHAFKTMSTLPVLKIWQSLHPENYTGWKFHTTLCRSYCTWKQHRKVAIENVRRFLEQFIMGTVSKWNEIKNGTLGGFVWTSSLSLFCLTLTDFILLHLNWFYLLLFVFFKLHDIVYFTVWAGSFSETVSKL